MVKILFVCHGNICRSPMAEFVMKDMVRRAGLERAFEIASAATSSEELGNPVYPPVRRLLAAHGIDCSGKTARRLRQDDYDRWDLIIGMDEENMFNMRRLFSGDRAGKLHNMLEYAGRPNDPVADPWYTRDFERTWQDITDSCAGLLEQLTGTVLLDFSDCAGVKALYRELRKKMAWEDWYGENLDALYDILSGLPHKGHRFVFAMPADTADEETAACAARIKQVFSDAGKEVV